MAKAKILFVFGTHEFGLPMGNKLFFRKAATPFIEEQVRNGKKVAVVFELGYTEEMFTNKLSDEEMWRAVEQTGGIRRANDFNVRELFRKAQSRINAELASTLGEGRRGKEEMIDWGFNGAISSLNLRRPGTVLSVVEPPPEPEATYSYWRARILSKRIGNIGFWTEKRVELLKEWIKYESRAIVLRDKSTSGLIVGLSKSHEALVVPRGAYHAGMIELFDPEAFEIRVVKDRRSGESFLYDVARESCRRELGEEELLGYAKLEAAYRNYFESRGLRSKVNLVLNFIAPGLRKSEYEKAREHAIRSEARNSKT